MSNKSFFRAVSIAGLVLLAVSVSPWLYLFLLAVLHRAPRDTSVLGMTGMVLIYFVGVPGLALVLTGLALTAVTALRESFRRRH